MSPRHSPSRTQAQFAQLARSSIKRQPFGLLHIEAQTRNPEKPYHGELTQIAPYLPNSNNKA